MGKGQIPKHAFKKGQSGNPSGRPKLPKDIVEGRKLNQIEVVRIFNEFSNYSAAQMRDLLNNPETKAFELLIGKIMFEAIKHGDHQRMNFILDRMVGKVVDRMDVTTAGESIKVDKSNTDEIKKIIKKFETDY